MGPRPRRGGMVSRCLMRQPSEQTKGESKMDKAATIEDIIDALDPHTQIDVNTEIN